MSMTGIIATLTGPQTSGSVGVKKKFGLFHDSTDFIGISVSESSSSLE